MRTRVVLPLIAAWLIGLATFWSAATLSGGWHSYVLFDEWGCKSIIRNGVDFGSGTEIVPNQPNPCYQRYARFHLP